MQEDNQPISTACLCQGHIQGLLQFCPPSLPLGTLLLGAFHCSLKTVSTRRDRTATCMVQTIAAAHSLLRAATPVPALEGDAVLIPGEPAASLPMWLAAALETSRWSPTAAQAASAACSFEAAKALVGTSSAVLCRDDAALALQAAASPSVTALAQVLDECRAQLTPPPTQPAAAAPALRGRRSKRRARGKGTRAHAPPLAFVCALAGETPAEHPPSHPALLAATVALLGLSSCSSHLSLQQVRDVLRETLRCAVGPAFETAARPPLRRLLAVQLLQRAVCARHWQAVAALTEEVLLNHNDACSDVLFFVGVLAGHDSAHARVLASRQLSPESVSQLLVLAVLRHLAASAAGDAAAQEACKHILVHFRHFLRLHCDWDAVSVGSRLLGGEQPPVLSAQNTVEFLQNKEPQQDFQAHKSHRTALMLASDSDLCELEHSCSSVFGLKVPLPKPIPDHAVLSQAQLPPNWPASMLLCDDDAGVEKRAAAAKGDPPSTVSLAHVSPAAAGAGAASSSYRHPNNKKPSYPKPNTFLSIRLGSAALKAHAEQLQAALVAGQPVLAGACTPTTRQHLTLFVMQLQTDRQREKAKHVMRDAAEELRAIFAPHLASTPNGQQVQLRVGGLVEMRGRVAALAVEDDSTLRAVREAVHCLHARFSKAGLTQEAAAAPGRWGPPADGEVAAWSASAARNWLPHSTFMKLSMLRGRTGSRAPPKRIDMSPLQGREGGASLSARVLTEGFVSIELCAMGGDEEGFYPVVASSALC